MKSGIEKHIDLLGFRVKDKVTGFVGVVETIGFDLYGCVQAIVRPQLDSKKSNELPSCSWLDVKRLEKVGTKRVMEPPMAQFSQGQEIGGTEKPMQRR